VLGYDGFTETSFFDGASSLSQWPICILYGGDENLGPWLELESLRNWA